MDLNDLVVFHLSKKSLKSNPSFLETGCEVSQTAFYLETCQRWLLVSKSDHLKQFFKNSFLADTPFKKIEGVEGYQFLLRLATGLESEIQGETDVFGQVKEAWRQFESLKTPFSKELNPWMRKLFEDTKEIRTQFLQNLGGNSYGSLVRKLIKDRQGWSSGSKGPLFLVGAGQMAHSVAPFLRPLLENNELWLWNRSSDRLAKFHQFLLSRVSAELRAEIQLLSDESRGWKEASTIVVCTPFQRDQDRQRVQWIQKRSSDCLVIHLGGLKEHCGQWSALKGFHSLNDLFSLQDSIKNVRSLQIEQAHQACEERSKLRALNSALHSGHSGRVAPSLAECTKKLYLEENDEKVFETWNSKIIAGLDSKHLGRSGGGTS